MGSGLLGRALWVDEDQGLEAMARSGATGCSADGFPDCHGSVLQSAGQH
jgi:hypothetical protein